jgi:hypothetical protein
MATTFRLFLCAAAFAVPAFAFSQLAAPTKGRVLLLENERIFEGDIEKFGDKYCVRRLNAGETWIPGDKVVLLCASRLEAYEHLRKQANLNDPDELLRLARWCQMQDLREQAVADLHEALILQPEHDETRRLLKHLEQAAVERTATTPSQPVPKSATRPEPKPVQTASTGLELNAECMGLFARRVQPILMNTCASCHASGRGGEFKLTQVFGDAPLGGKSSQQNLTAVLSQIKPEQPLGSPLLLMAASAHGGSAQPPLKGRQTPAFKALEQWVRLTSAHVPKSPQAEGPQERAPKNVLEGVERKPTNDPATLRNPEPASGRETFAGQESAKPAEPVDEFDPIFFNQQMHPEKKRGVAGHRLEKR